MDNTKRGARHAACLAFLKEMRREEETRKRGWAYALVNKLFKLRLSGQRPRWYERDRRLIEQAVCEYEGLNSMVDQNSARCSLGEELLLKDGWRMRVLPWDPSGGGEIFTTTRNIAKIRSRSYVFESN